MASDRRDFLKRAAMTAAAVSVSAPAALVEGQALAAAPPRTEDSNGSSVGVAPLDDRLMHAMGEAVLPESLGASSRAEAIASFQSWLADYRPVSEEMHGYGYAEITYTPSDPVPGWSAQLAGLELLARQRHRVGFAELSIERRRAVLETQLARVPGTRLPSNPVLAGHVAIALLAHWAASSAATDLAYGARIEKGNCRVLAETTRRPLPLAEGRGT